jgi:hypothetical protein
MMMIMITMNTFELEQFIPSLQDVFGRVPFASIEQRYFVRVFGNIILLSWRPFHIELRAAALLQESLRCPGSLNLASA